jgi:hypothetical protein
VTMLPAAVSRDLAKHLETIRDQHEGCPGHLYGNAARPGRSASPCPDWSSPEVRQDGMGMSRRGERRPKADARVWRRPAAVPMLRARVRRKPVGGKASVGLPSDPFPRGLGRGTAHGQTGW